MSYRFDHLDREPVSVRHDGVESLLPEFFQSQYPNIITFLKYYYEFLENQDETQSFSHLIQTAFQVRDIEGGTLNNLDQLLFEIGFGTQRNEFDSTIDPRHAAKLISYFYRAKGREISAEGLFHAFFGEDVEIVYPKRNIFTLNVSKLGAEYQNYIRDDKRYQVYSILIKSGITLKKWERVFKRFVHPAGFYLAADVSLIDTATLSITGPAVSLDSDAGVIALFGEANMSSDFSALTSITGIYADTDDSDAFADRIRLDRKISELSGVQISLIDSQYDTLAEFLSPNSPTLDEDSDGIINVVTLSNTIEKLDDATFDHGNPAKYRDSD
jgi:hypothetical protein